MKFKKGYDNTLILGVTGKSACRENNVYVNNKLISRISSIHSMTDNIHLAIPKEIVDIATGNEMEVKITHDSAWYCYGFDLYKVKTAYSTCNCK